MTILDTVQIYTTPLWFTLTMIITGAIFIGTIINADNFDNKVISILLIICLIILLTGLILGLTGVIKQYDHDEYIIELDETQSATEFFQKYEITKTFEYSNAWQVKKKDGVE